MTLRRLLWVATAGAPITLARRVSRWIYSSREYNVLEFDVATTGAARLPAAGHEIQVLDRPSVALREFCRARHDAWHQDGESAVRGLTRRFARGELCFGLLYDGRMTTHVWSNESSWREPLLDRLRPVARDEVVLYDIYTLPEYRGRRHYDELFVYFAGWFQRQGKRRVVLTVNGDNLPSLRANLRAGIDRVGFRVSCRRLFGRERITRLPAPIPLRELTAAS